MKIEFDPAKDIVNRAKHGLSLADVVEFDFDSAIAQVDTRLDYGETRYRAFVRMDGLGYALAFTLEGVTLRPII